MMKRTLVAALLAVLWAGTGPRVDLAWIDAYNPATTAALHAAEPSTERVIWWVAGDPHVGHGSEAFPGQHVAKAVADVNELEIADEAILLGDLVEDRATFGEIFVREMDKLKVDWTYVLGNHDFDRTTGRPVLPPRYGARTVQGIRFITLSDEVSGSTDRNLVMSDAQEKWFWEELATHRDTDTPIFLFTHQPHPEFAKWPQLREVLDEYNIVAWFSAHKHRWDIRKDAGVGFIQVNIHSIGGVREDYLSTFLYLDRTGDTVEATIRFRNHEKREWIQVDGQDQVTFSVDLASDGCRAASGP
jgi:hypothetical protein